MTTFLVDISLGKAVPDGAATSGLYQFADAAEGL